MYPVTRRPISPPVFVSHRIVRCTGKTAVGAEARVMGGGGLRPGKRAHLRGALTRRRAAEKRDELATFNATAHSITSSAATSRVCGTLRPSALAVLRLMARTNLLACSTGRSAGLLPLRIRPT